MPLTALYLILLQSALAGCVVALLMALRRGRSADPVARIECAAEARLWALAALAVIMALAAGGSRPASAATPEPPPGRSVWTISPSPGHPGGAVC